MLIRALIVLLLAFNLGVAAWWLLRAPPPRVEPVQPAGVPRLLMPGESSASPDAGASARAARQAPVPAPQCVALGPFPDTAAAERARAALPPITEAVNERRVYRDPPRAWRVYLPPFGTAAEATAAAERVAGAGFDDYFVVRTGADANSVALGRYGNPASASARAQALVDAGFPAVAGPIESGPYVLWLDIRAAAGQDLSLLQRAAQAAELETIDCDASATGARVAAG